MNDDARIAALEQQVAALTRQVGLLEDTFAVRHLQFKYGYYMDKCLYDPIIDLMADDCEIHFLGGVFRGKEGAGRLYCGRLRNRFAGGTDGPKPGLLMDHPQLQDIVDVAPDGLTARGRFRYLMQAGTHYTTGTAHQWWEGGLYENTYVKRDGAWQIQIIVPKMCYVGYYEHGWAYTKPDAINNLSKTFPEDPYGFDELADAPLVLWPQTDILPFHYPHPVTGEPVEMENDPMTMNFDLSHHVALVTGGGRGFGRAIACHLAAAGAAVAVTSRSADELRQTVSLIEAAGGKAFAVTGDVTERADVERIVAATEQALGGISIFINNAGVPDPFGPIGVIDPDRWWHTQAVHVRAPMLFLTALLPGMQQRGLGRIVLVSAKASRVDAPNLSAYCVAKTGQNRIARMVAAENVDNGLAIFAIDPGFAYTGLAASTAKSPDAQRWLPGMVGRLNALAESAGSDDDLRRCGERCVALASGRYDALSGSYMELPDDPEVLLAAKQAPTA